MRALIVYTELTDEDSVISHAVARLASELNDEHVETVIIRDFEDFRRLSRLYCWASSRRNYSLPRSITPSINEKPN